MTNQSAPSATAPTKESAPMTYARMRASELFKPDVRVVEATFAAELEARACLDPVACETHNGCARAIPSTVGANGDVLAKIEKALTHVHDLCQGREKWTMRVPARPDLDSDLIICDALEAARSALSARNDNFTLEAADALFGCHVEPTINEYHERGFKCACCECPIDIKAWVHAEHEADCIINRVRDYLAVHRPESVRSFGVDWVASVDRNEHAK